jgi:hypothetical protein
MRSQLLNTTIQNIAMQRALSKQERKKKEEENAE